MTWSDTFGPAGIATHRYADGAAWAYAAGGVTEDGAAPRANDAAIVADVFNVFGEDLRQVSVVEDVPIELIAAPVCIVADRAGSAMEAARYADYQPDFRGDDETPELVYAGCTGLRFDLVRALLGPITVDAYLAPPLTAITAAARHISGAAGQTRFQVPMVAAAYNTDGVRYDGSSRWRMAPAEQIDNFVWWFNTIVRAAQFDASLIGTAPSFTAVLATIPGPQQPTPNPVPQSRYRRPESQAAVDAGVMIISESNPGLSAIWSLDTTTTDQIGAVAKDAASGLGLPMGLPMFAYPDRGGTMRIMNTNEVQAIYRAMRDYLAQIAYFDSGRSESLPGQPVAIP